MARLPTAADFGSRPIPQARGPISADHSGEIMGEGIQQAGATLTRLGQQQMDLEDRFTYAQARSQLLTADLQQRSALANDPDFTTAEQRYREAMTKQVADASKLIRSNPDRAAFVSESRLDLLRGSVQVQQMARQKETDAGRATLQATLDNNREAALSAPDEATRSALIRNAQDAIAATKERGYITEQEAVAQQKAWTQDYAEGAMVLMSPTERIQTLEHPEGTPAEFIPIDRRMELDDAARRQRLADQELQLRYSERAQKERADAAAKEGDSILAQGQMTTAWLETHRDILDPGDFRYFYGKLTGDNGAEGPRDPIAYADLRERAGRGEDIREQARAALQSQTIRTSDYNTLLTEVESERSGWYKRGVQFIGTSAAVSDLNPDPAAAQRKAIMLDDWDAWGSAHPGATDEEATKEYRRIVDDYALVDRNAMILLKPKPHYLVGDIVTPDLDATEDRTLQAFEAGEISEEDFKKQSAMIADWRKAYPPAPEKKK